jgi:NAD(P)-dependent dehydrogenase (short-subunit alcohol dehydrogenase family)
MLTTQYAKALQRIRINATDPGYTATDHNGNSGHQSMNDGTDAIVTLATARAAQRTGRFISREGEIAWS